MSKKSIAILCLFICLFSGLNLQSQTEENDRKPLVEVLSFIEEKYAVSFSYIDNTVVDKNVTPPNENSTITALIDALIVETGLNFEFLDNRFIVISTNESHSASEAFKTQFLKEVILNKYLASGLSRNNSGIVTIKPEKFDILPGLIEPDVLQTIQSLPGVVSVDETVSNINIRGGTHDQNLILWDGIKMYQSGHFFGLISAYNPYLTTEVNVSKNGTSAQFGDGVSSVIDMQLSNTISNKFKAGAGFNLVHADAFVKTPITKKIELQVSARRSLTDLVNAPTYKQYFNRIFQDSDFENNQENTISKDETFYFYDFTGKLLYDISKKDKIRLSFLTIYNNLNYEEQSTINEIDESLNSKLIQRNIAGGLNYSRDWNSKFSTSLRFNISNYDLDAVNFDVLNNQRLNQDNEVLDTSVKLDANWIISKHLSLLSGYQFFEVGISNLEDVNNPDFRSFIKEVNRTHSVFTEAHYLSKNLNTNIKFGARLNYISKFDTILVEPRLSFSQRFAHYFRLEILGEFKSQSTSQIIDLQNDFLGIEKRRWVLSNDTTIPVIKSKQASIGIHYNQNNLIASVEAFYKYVDGITSRSQGFQNQFQFVNAIGSYQIRGLDFLINKQFNQYSFWLSYSFSQNDYTFDSLNDGNIFPNNTDIAHAITFANTYSLNNFKFALGVNWHSGKPFTEPNNLNPIVDNGINYSLPNSNNLKDYLRIDLSATYNFKLSESIKSEIGASIWNVLNTENVINTYYTIDSENTISKIENQSLGITPNISFRLNF